MTGKNGNNSEIEQAARSAASGFGFSPKSVTCLGQSSRSFLVESRDEQGKTKKIFLKFSHENPGFQLSLYRELDTCGFQLIPEYLEAPAGGFVLADESELFWTCQPYTPGKSDYDWLNFDCSPYHCLSAGQALAHLHKVGFDLLRKKRIKPEAPVFARDVFSAFPLRFRRSIEGFATYSKSSAVQSSMNGIDSKTPEKLLACLPFQALLEKSLEVSARLSELEKAASSFFTVNHGDFHPGNLLFANHVVLAVVDWDYACLGSNVYDLSYALFVFCLQPAAVSGKTGAEFFNPQKTAAFLEGYTQSMTSTRSLKHLAGYTEFVHLLMLEWVLSELNSGNSNYVKANGFVELAEVLALIFAAA